MFAGLLLVLLVGVPLARAGDPDDEPDFATRLRERVEALTDPGAAAASGESLARTEELRAFYTGRAFQPVWVRAAGRRRLDGLIDSIHGAADDGLVPDDYHLDGLERLRGTLAPSGRRDAGARVDLELLASDAALLLASHLAAGKVDPVALDPEWQSPGRRAQPVDALNRMAAGEPVGSVLYALRPADASYGGLRARLAELRRIRDAEPPPVGPGPTLTAGDRDPRVARIRARLVWLGDLAPAEREAGEPDLYDNGLRTAVVAFQSRHGLAADGAVGAATIRVLDLTAALRIVAVRVNLERRRWLPDTLGPRYIGVNIADFSLLHLDPDLGALRMRAVVGRPYRRTPVFASRVTYLVFNPAWSVPRTIAVEDLLPRLREDPGAYERRGFSVLEGWGAEERAHAPTEIDWTQYSKNRFPFHLRQAPGPENALGRVKFMFPNPFSVYLHDTPAHTLFRKSSRAFSSGCIRLEEAMTLARRLLHDQVPDPEDTIVHLLDDGAEHVVQLKRPIPLYLLYRTAWVDDAGVLQWRDDVYGRDPPVLEALDRPVGGTAR